MRRPKNQGVVLMFCSEYGECNEGQGQFQQGTVAEFRIEKFKRRWVGSRLLLIEHGSNFDTLRKTVGGTSGTVAAKCKICIANVEQIKFSVESFSFLASGMERLPMKGEQGNEEEQTAGVTG